MAENSVQSETAHGEIRQKQHSVITASPAIDPAASAAPIIWTPKFIVIFALLLAIGLSMGTVLTQGWLNGYYRPEVILLIYTALIFACWCLVILRARSSWIRIGAIFSAIWTIFSGLNFVISLIAIDPHAPIIAHLNVATNSALLAASICLSTARTPSNRWDSRFFTIAPIVGLMLIVALYVFTPAAGRSFISLQSNIAAIVLYLSIATWWLRPSCWLRQPGPTFLFGFAPGILLILAIPHIANGEANFFFLQVTLLCFLLATLRILQCELRH